MATKRRRKAEARARRAGARSPTPEVGAAGAQRQGFLASARAAYSATTAEQERNRPPRKNERRSVVYQRPPGPWGSFPVSELVVGVGAVVLVIGIVRGPAEGLVPILAGISLCLLGVVEYTLREHLSGLRSHALLLAVLATVVTHTVLTLLLRVDTLFVLPVDVVVLIGVFSGLRGLFRRRAIVGGTTRR